MSTSTTKAAHEKILFIPHDNRPISCKQTAEVVEKAGIEILMPPENILSGGEISQDGKDVVYPDELWSWLKKNASSADAAVISSDALLYGGLIPSRKHEIPQEILNARVENLKKLRADNTNLNIYVFGSLMRTPAYGTRGDIEEPEYYAEHGRVIHDYTVLLDKNEIAELDKNEQNYFDWLEKNIPAAYLNDWLDRRKKNFDATKKLIDLTDEGIIDCLVIGRDDNAPLGQTHRENRALLWYANKINISKQKFQTLTGIDEFGLLMLTRAVNDLRGEYPKINVRYNKGKGADTIPAYADDTIGAAIKNEVTIVGGVLVPDPGTADFVLLINTDPEGKTFSLHNPMPDGKQNPASDKSDRGTRYFAKMVDECVKAGYPVGIADINYSNGSDNALMKMLRDKNLLFKLTTYSGWNTATNSTGFALGTGILSRYMTDESRKKLLARRYLDDWAYQANVRTIAGNILFNASNSAESYFQFQNVGERETMENINTKLLREFAEKNLPHFKFLRDFKVINTWNRMFECNIIFKDDKDFE